MIRPITLVTFAAFIGSGLYLYQVKHQAQLVDRQIRKVREATDAARARAGVLRADYALLNDPDRLAELAAAYVPELKATQPGQWSSMAEIERRLPPVGAPTAEPAPLEPPPPSQAAPPPMAARAMPAPVAHAEPPKSAPTLVASAPQPAMPPRVAPAPAAAPAPTIAAARAATVTTRAAPAPQLARATPAAPPVQIAPAIVQVAPVPPPPRPVPTPTPVARLLPRVSPPAGASLLAIAARPLPPGGYGAPPTMPVQAVARLGRGATTDPPLPVVASALGMARTMLSLAPVSSADAGPLFPPAPTR